MTRSHIPPEMIKLMEKMIARQLSLGNQVLALQSICTTLIAELCVSERDPMAKLIEIQGDITGTASAVADQFRVCDLPDQFDTRDITQMAEMVAALSEDKLQRRLLAASTPTAGT